MEHIGVSCNPGSLCFVMVKLNQLSHIPKERTQDLFTFKTITRTGL